MEKVNEHRSIYTPVYAKIVNRLAAFLLDAVLFIVLFTGVLFISSAIVNFDEHNNALHEEYRNIGFELFNDETQEYYIIDENNVNFENVMDLYKNSEIIKVEEAFVDKFVVYSPLVSIFFALFILECIVPLILKNGQTVGMKCFHVGLISNNHLAVKPMQVFIRGLIGKTVVLGMIPYICMFLAFFNPAGGATGSMLLVIILIVNFGAMLFSKRKAGISDLIAQVFPVDATQTVFYKTMEEFDCARREEEKLLKTQKKVY